MMTFNGCGVALVTPFKSGKVHLETLKKLLDFHLQNKTDYLVLLGSTAEAQTLSMREKKMIIEYAIEYVNKRVPIVIGTGTNDTKTTLSFSKYAMKAGADGILVVTPYYNRPTQRGLIAHFKKIARGVSIPVILYNVPSRTGINMLPQTVHQLSKIENIVGIKEASGDLTQISEIIQLCGKDFLVLSGNDDQVYDVLKLGGHGVISVVANIIPQIFQSLVQSFDSKIDVKDRFDHFNELIETIFIETNPIPIKKALNYMGFEVGKPRLPLLEIEKKHDVLLYEILLKYGLVKV